MVVENQGFTITLQMTNSAAAVFLVVLYLHFPKIFVVDWLSFTAITKTPSVLAISTFEKTHTHTQHSHTIWEWFLIFVLLHRVAIVFPRKNPIKSLQFTSSGIGRHAISIK